VAGWAVVKLTVAVGVFAILGIAVLAIDEPVTATARTRLDIEVE